MSSKGKSYVTGKVNGKRTILQPNTNFKDKIKSDNFMRETKDQKIKRLEKAIEEQKQELTEVKKDRKRLNYTVERLEREKEKLSLQSSNELEKQTLSNQSEIDSLIRQIRELKEENEKLTDFRNKVKEKILQKRADNKERLWRLENFLSEYITDKWGQLFFDIDTLITRINPLNGRYPSIEQIKQIKKELEDKPEYKEALQRIELLKRKIKEEDGEAIEIFYSECKKLMKKYVSVFFEIPGGDDLIS